MLNILVVALDAHCSRCCLICFISVCIVLWFTMLHIALLFYMPMICHSKFEEKLGAVMLFDQAKRQLNSLNTSHSVLWIKGYNIMKQNSSAPT